MDHRQANASKAAERYVLGEMNEPERFAFEGHYFECEECADDVRVASALARGVQAVCAEDASLRPLTGVVAGKPPRRGWFAWLAPGARVPSALALSMAGLAGYLLLVAMPGQRSQSSALAPIVLRAAARGEEQALAVDRRQPLSAFSLDVNNVDPGAPLTYQVIAPGGAIKMTGTAQAPPLASPLIVVVQNSELREAGAWTLLLKTQQGTEAGRYPFTVQLK